MRRLKALFLALFVVALPLPLSAQTFSPLAGKWKGTVKQPGHGSYSVTMVLVHFRPGATAGTIDYPSLGRGGRLAALSSGEGEFSFREVLEWGLKRCVNNGRVTVAFEGEGVLMWRWFYPDGRRGAWAKLKKMAALGGGM